MFGVSGSARSANISLPRKAGPRRKRSGAFMTAGRLSAMAESTSWPRTNDQRRRAGVRDAYPWRMEETHRIVDRLTGLVEKAMSSNRSPRDIVLGLLSWTSTPTAGRIRRDQTEDGTAGFLEAPTTRRLRGRGAGRSSWNDVFWEVLLSAHEAGRRLPFSTSTATRAVGRPD